MKKLIARLKVYAFAVSALGKKAFKKEANQNGLEDVLFV
jgi:hypothetical protein